MSPYPFARLTVIMRLTLNNRLRIHFSWVAFIRSESDPP